MNLVGFTELVGNCEENFRNVDLEEYSIGVCEEFGLDTHTSDLRILYGVLYFLHISMYFLIRNTKCNE